MEINQETLYMQKLAGIITESEYNRKLEEISFKGVKGALGAVGKKVKGAASKVASKIGDKARGAASSIKKGVDDIGQAYKAGKQEDLQQQIADLAQAMNDRKLKGTNNIEAGKFIDEYVAKMKERDYDRDKAIEVMRTSVDSYPQDYLGKSLPPLNKKKFKAKWDDVKDVLDTKEEIGDLQDAYQELTGGKPYQLGKAVHKPAMNEELKKIIREEILSVMK